MIRRLIPLAVLAALVSLALVACGQPVPAPAPEPTPVNPSPPPPPAAPVPPTPTPAPEQPGQPGQPAGEGTPVDVNLEDPGGSGAYVFDPAEFTFNSGETVTFTLTAETEFHTFSVDDLGIDAQVDANDTQTLTYTFDQAGAYELYCLPHETLGMVGTITVQ